MRAVLVEEFGPPEKLAIRDVPEPRLGPGEALVEVLAAGVNFPDLLVAAGTYQTLNPLPFVPGKEGAGIVRALGPDVVGLRVGERVSFEVEAGAFAEFVAVQAAHCFPIPDDVPTEVAATLGLAYQTAYFALTEDGRLNPGDWVLVLGASGGVGLAAVQLAKAAGARAIAAVGSPAKIDYVRGHGAEFVIDVSEDRSSEFLREQVRKVSDKGGVDVVIDPVGGALFDAALRTLLPRGRMVVVGFASGEFGTVRANYLLIKNISVVGSNWGFFRDHAHRRIADAQAKIFELVRSGAVKSPLTKVLPLERVGEALRSMQDRGAMGKVALTITSRREGSASRS